MLPPQKILHVVPRWEAGGAERLVARLNLSLNRSHHHSTIVCLGSPSPHSNLHPDAPSTYLNHSSWIRDWVGAKVCQRKVAKILQTGTPDLVHLHLWPAARLVAPVARSLNVPCLVHIHDCQPWLSETGIKARATRYLVGRALGSEVHYAAVAPQVAAHSTRYLAVPKQRVTVIANGPQVAVRKSSWDSHSQLTLTMAGRLEPEKNHQLALQAVARLRDLSIPARLRIAGSGSLEAFLQQEVRRLGVSDLVEFLGWLPDISDLLAQTDVFLMPSSHEGMPLALLEAMEVGIPCVVTEAAAAGVVDQESGRVIANDLDSLVRALIELRAPELRETLGRRAIETIEKNYSWRKFESGVTALYEQILSARRPL